MKVNVEDIDSTRKKITVSVPAAAVAEKRDSVFRSVMGEVTVKGFRKGKVPRRVVESMYGREIDQDTISGLVSDTLTDALMNRSLSPVSRPDVTDVGELDAAGGFTYCAEFEVLPKFDLSDYVGVSLEKRTREVTEEDVDREIQELRARGGTSKLVEEDRSARKGDHVVVDYAGEFENGETSDDLNRKDVTLALGSDAGAPEFEENILGKKAGEEAEFSMTYPEDFIIPEAAGRTVRYSLKLKEIREVILPELDDEFAKDLGEEDVAGLRKSLKERISQHHDMMENSRMKDQAISKLLENNVFDIPPSLLEKQKEYLKARFVSDMRSRGVESPEVDETGDGKFSEKAAESLRTTVILDRIAKAENISAEETEVSSEIERIAASYGVEPDAVFKAYSEKGMMDNLRDGITSRKVLDFIVDKALVEEVSWSPHPIDKETAD